MVGGGPIVAEGGEKLPEPRALQGQSLFAATLALEVAAEPHVVAGQGAQCDVRLLSATGLRGFPPAVHR